MEEEEKLLTESLLKDKPKKDKKPKVNDNIVVKPPKEFAVRQLSGVIGGSVEGSSSRKLGGSHIKSMRSD